MDWKSRLRNKTLEKGTYSSGLHHYISYGFKENRKVSK